MLRWVMRGRTLIGVENGAKKVCSVAGSCGFCPETLPPVCEGFVKRCKGEQKQKLCKKKIGEKLVERRLSIPSAQVRLVQVLDQAFTCVQNILQWAREVL